MLTAMLGGTVFGGPVDWLVGPLQFGFMRRALLVAVVAGVVGAVLSCWLTLIGWSLLVTAFLQLSQLNFLTIPAPILTIVGSALVCVTARALTQLPSLRPFSGPEATVMHVA